MENENNIKDKSFINGALILTVAGVIAKILGAVYKIPLGKLLGDVGASYQGFVYPYFNWAASILTSGFPIAIAKLVSEFSANDRNIEAEKVFIVARKFMMSIGLFLSLVLFIFAPYITNTLSGSKYSMQSMSFGIFFIATTYAYRGYFQGNQNLKYYAVASVLEQGAKVVFGLLIVVILLKMKFDITIVTAASAFSSSLGIMLSSLFLLYSHKKFLKRNNISPKIIVRRREAYIILKKILMITIPITIGAVVINAINMFEGRIVIDNICKFGAIPREEAGVLYGYYSYYTASIINFPQILFTPITVSIFPVLASLLSNRNYEQVTKVINVGSKVLLFIIMPCTVGLFMLSTEILAFLWPSLTDMIYYTSPILKIMSFMVLSLAIYSLTTNILNAMGKVNIPSKNLIIGAFCRLFLCYVLSMTNVIGYLAAPIGSFASFAIAMVLNIFMIKKYAKFRYSFLYSLYKPLIASLAMGGVIFILKVLAIKFIPDIISVYLSRNYKIYVLSVILVASFSYLIFLKLFNCIGKEELEFLPGKRFLRKIFNK